jgi:hypothetical protein
MSPYNPMVHKAVTALRRKLNVRDEVTVSDEFGKEYSCSFIFNDDGHISDIVFHSEAAELMFKLKWA